MLCLSLGNASTLSQPSTSSMPFMDKFVCGTRTESANFPGSGYKQTFLCSAMSFHLNLLWFFSHLTISFLLCCSVAFPKHRFVLISHALSSIATRCIFWFGCKKHGHVSPFHPRSPFNVTNIFHGA